MTAPVSQLPRSCHRLESQMVLPGYSYITQKRQIRGAEAENERIQIPSSLRWLSGAPSVKARFSEGNIRASSVVLAVPDEVAYAYHSQEKGCAALELPL